MKTSQYLIRGTLLLTAAGFLTRIIGFYYRIFLSQIIGAEGIGIYQLIFPVYALCFSLTAAGIQTAISRLVASSLAKDNHAAAHKTLLVGLLLSVSLSIGCAIILYNNATFIATNLLMDRRCDSLLKIMVYSLPLGSIHSCISGYYYGCKKAGVPAISQLVEQLVRVTSVYIIYKIFLSNQINTGIELAAAGLVTGEFASMLLSVTAYNLTGNTIKKINSLPKINMKSSHILQSVLSQAVPLTLNRVLLNILQSVEAILIPVKLQTYGMTNQQALSVYGILTGMALPLILFPCALTNSLSVLLLPAIAEAQAKKNYRVIGKIVNKAIFYCILFGFVCTILFLISGNLIGRLLFKNEAVTPFVLTLAWICPFLYLSTTLSSIIHGLGRTTTSFVFNIISLLLRISFVVFLVPSVGIKGYLWGLLASQLLLSCLLVIYLKCNKAIHTASQKKVAHKE